MYTGVTFSQHSVYTHTDNIMFLSSNKKKFSQGHDFDDILLLPFCDPINFVISKVTFIHYV